MGNTDIEHLIDRAAALISESARVVVFTGAGVSTESGIPDFRSPGGIWSKLDPDSFTIQKFLQSRQIREMQWRLLAEGGLLKEAEPNPAHYAIAELEKIGKLSCVITQNVDNLHQRAGNSPQKVFELHGNMRWVRCLGCNVRFPMEEVLKRVSMEGVPDCTLCQGILKPDAVFFGEALPRAVLTAAASYSRNCDLFVVIGSTLVVYPAAYMPMYAIEAGAKLVIVNLTPTPMDTYASVVIRAKAGEVMPRVVEVVKKNLAAT